MKTYSRCLVSASISLVAAFCPRERAAAEGFGPTCAYVQASRRPGDVDHRIYGLGATTAFFTNFLPRHDSYDVWGLHLNLIDGTVLGEPRYLRVAGVDIDVLHTILYAVPLLGAGATEVCGIQAGFWSEATWRYGIGAAPFLVSDVGRGVDIGGMVASDDFSGLALGALATDCTADADGSFIFQAGAINLRREYAANAAGVMIGAFNRRTAERRGKEPPSDGAFSCVHFGDADGRERIPESTLFQIGLYNSFAGATAGGFVFQFGVFNTFSSASPSKATVLQIGAINHIQEAAAPVLPLANLRF